MIVEQANAFAGTFAFLPTLEPTQKKQKSLQATAQGQCKLDTTAPTGASMGVKNQESSAMFFRAIILHFIKLLYTRKTICAAEEAISQPNLFYFTT